MLYETDTTLRETSSVSHRHTVEVPPAPATPSLVETIAGEAAQLLIEAAEARQRAMTMNNEPSAGDLLKSATALEQHAANWEKRLGWWRRLRQRDGARRP